MTTKHDNIRSLDDRQKSREKISIWYGSEENFYHGSKEIIANATDEIVNNFENGEILVELAEDLQTLSVSDTGRGMPLDGETDGVKNYDLLFRILFAGTKYEETDANTTGTNGVGGTVLNYTSSIFHVESCYNGNRWTIKFENGGQIVEELKSEPCSKTLHGTKITFKLDNEIYPIITYTEDDMRGIVKRFSVGASKVKLTFKYNGKSEVFHYNNAREYFDEIVGNQATSPIASAGKTLYEDDGEKTSLELSFATCPEPIQESYLNLTYLSEMGSFHDGIIAGVRTFANKYCKDNNLFPKGTKAFLVGDIETSVSYVCVASSNNVQFQNQTKLSTNKSLYKKVAKNHTQHLLDVLAVENPRGLKKMMDHLLTVQKYNENSQKAKAKLKSKLSEKVDGIGNKVANLVDCAKHGAESEIFIAEGNSALGSIVLARDANFQAAYPLRGKILNCLKADYPVIFKNQVITDLVKVLGCGIQADKKNKDLDSFDISKLRFGKVIIATDADSDGFQIACLIITMFYRLMPKLITEGFIYIAQTPLYEIKYEDDTMSYFFSEKEKDDGLASLKGKYVISRSKGLGELEAITMNETAMDPETRNLVRVTVDNAEEMVKTLETWMATAVDGRKEYISENLYKYVDSID